MRPWMTNLHEISSWFESMCHKMIWTSDIVGSSTDCIPTFNSSIYTIYPFQAFSDSEPLNTCTSTFETALQTRSFVCLVFGRRFKGMLTYFSSSYRSHAVIDHFLVIMYAGLPSKLAENANGIFFLWTKARYI